MIMKRKLVFLFLISTVILMQACNQSKSSNSNQVSKNVIHLTNETFKQKVFNYSANKEWKYEGEKPAIVDFYATWCGPCSQLSPILEEIAKEYDGKLVLYKVDVDKEKELTQMMGVEALPSLIFIPANGTPFTSVGFINKDSLLKNVATILKTIN